MDLLWPGFLYLLGLIPLMIIVYIWILRRRRRFAVRYSSLSLVREALPQHSHLRRHLPFALFLLALTSLVLALVRPVSIVTVPSTERTIILAIDVSRSMCATDIKPNRLEAAKIAAISFIQSQDANTQIGLVAFAGFAAIVQSPTTDMEIMQDAIEELTVGRRTGIGHGILKSIDAIAEIDKSIAPSVTSISSAAPPLPVPEGAYSPAIIVLLTDGVSNAGPLPLDAAQQAADRGLRVYTIGFGTEENESMPDCGRFPMGGGGGFGGFGGGGFRRGIDEATLLQVSDMTGGAYFPAESSEQLQDVFQNIPTNLITKHVTTEISVFFAAIGALLAGLAIVLSLIWHPLF